MKLNKDFRNIKYGWSGGMSEPYCSYLYFKGEINLSSNKHILDILNNEYFKELGIMDINKLNDYINEYRDIYKDLSNKILNELSKINVPENEFVCDYISDQDYDDILNVISKDAPNRLLNDIDNIKTQINAKEVEINALEKENKKFEKEKKDFNEKYYNSLINDTLKNQLLDNVPYPTLKEELKIIFNNAKIKNLPDYFDSNIIKNTKTLSEIKNNDGINDKKINDILTNIKEEVEKDYQNKYNLIQTKINLNLTLITKNKESINMLESKVEKLNYTLSNIGKNTNMMVDYFIQFLGKEIRQEVK